MARTGRPPTPIETKRKRGTLRKDRMPAQALATIGPAARVLADAPPSEALELVMGHGVAWLGATDAPALALLRESLEERAALRVLVMGGSSETRKALRDLDKQIVGQLSALGFDPTARARLGLAEVSVQGNLSSSGPAGCPPLLTEPHAPSARSELGASDASTSRLATRTVD